MTGWMNIVVDDKIAKREAEYIFWELVLLDALVEQRRVRAR